MIDAAQTFQTASLLLVLDESSDSKRAIQYAGSLLGGRRGFRVELLRLLPPLPPELLEFGGAENPARERQLEAQLRRQQYEWIAAAEAGAQPALERALQQLRQAGLPRSSLGWSFSHPTDARDAARAVLEMAKAKHCRTVVLGHQSHSWFRGLGGGHLAEQILRQARGISLWVVQ